MDQSVERFKHTHKGSTEVIVVENISDRGSKTDRTVPSDEIGLTESILRESSGLGDQYRVGVLSVLFHGRDNFQKLILTQTPSLT